jgi:hypothetical protein
VASGLTLDSGALIAADKRDPRFWRIWAAALKREAEITVPAAVLAQVWRGNSPTIARLLNVCQVEALDEGCAKRIGNLLASSRRRADVVDAAVVVGAARRGDAIVTSDPADIAHLIDVAGANLLILSV